MKPYIHHFIKKSLFVNWFLRAPMPSWLVLYVDVLLALIASFITFYCNGDSTLGFNGIIYDIWLKALIFTAITFGAMLLCRSYKSIVRISAFEDTYRILGTISITTLVALIVDAALHPFIYINYFGTWNIVVVSFITFSFLITTRIVIKYVYTFASSNKDKKKRVVILGSAINSYALATALKNETDGQFDPVLLLSQSSGASNIQAGSIPIRKYDPDNIAEIFKKFNADTLIFLSTQLDFIRQGAGDAFLRNGIKLLMLNQIEEFKVTDDDSTPILSPHVQNIKIEDLLGRQPIVTETQHIKDQLAGRTVLITGAAGSIGSEIVRQVASFGAGCIVLVDQAETPMHEMQLEMEKTYPSTKIVLCIADVANTGRMESIFRKYRPAIVYHAAAYKHVPMMETNPGEATTTNIFGTKNVADLALKYDCEKFVMISTDKAVNPTNIMGASKRVAEIYVQSLANNLRTQNSGSRTRFITTRFGNVLGSNGSVIPLFRKQIENGGPVTVTHRDIIRYFMTIPEACSLVLEAACMGRGGEIFIFDMGKPVKIYDLASRMISLAGLRPHIDIKIVETGLRPGEKLYEELLNDKEHTLATHHKKIMIAQVRQYDYTTVCAHIDVLVDAVNNDDIHEVVAEIKRMVPEFVSRNSKWSDIDKEMENEDHIEELTDK